MRNYAVLAGLVSSLLPDDRNAAEILCIQEPAPWHFETGRPKCHAIGSPLVHPECVKAHLADEILRSQRLVDAALDAMDSGVLTVVVVDFPSA